MKPLTRGKDDISEFDRDHNKQTLIAAFAEILNVNLGGSDI
jgi:hypothetical protein